MEGRIIAILTIKEGRVGGGVRGAGVLITWDEEGGRGGGNLCRCWRRMCK